SGGEKRRAAIAGVMAMSPEVLVLDEPTAGLDPSGRDTILNLIKSYRDKTGATIIIVSHSMEDMAKVAEKILVMNQGEIAMFDKTEEIFSHGKELRAMGLNIPEITMIAEKLKQNGIMINENVFTVEALKNSILALKKEGIGHDQ
ncbi:MAG: ATP-binding cassette domain-containing protein, partial [Oscillospiraceae bacterium]